jgi:hypothetical protein
MGGEIMTTSAQESQRKDRPQGAPLVRICPEFSVLIKDVQQKTYAQSTAQATKIIYDQMIFDSNIAGIFQRLKKKV